MSGCCCAFLLLEKYIPKVLFTLRVRQLHVNQFETLFSTAVSFDAASMFGMSIDDRQVVNIYKQNKIGPKIDPCGTPMVLFAKEEHTSLILVHCFLEIK